MNENDIDAQVAASRHMNPDGSKVIYDLSVGVDFSSIKLAADAVARTIWERDLKGFWSETGGKMIFTPRYDVQVKLPSNLGHRGKKASALVEKDLEQEEMRREFTDYVKGVARREEGVGDISENATTSVLFSYLEEREIRGEVMDELFEKMTSHITIV